MARSTKPIRQRVRMEEVALDSKCRVDLKKGVVHNVLILGFDSTHGYSYLPQAMIGAKRLYEGMHINVDHPPDPRRPGMTRSYHDRFGHLEDITFDPRSGLRGDLHYNKMHPVAKQFAFDARNAPHRVGLSHNADAPVVSQNGRLVCPTITKVRSVDLVSNPGTTHGLFESQGDDDMKKVMVPRRRKPKAKITQRERLIKLLESADDNDPRIAALLEDAGAATLPAGDGLTGGVTVEALKGMVVAIFDDTKLTIKAKLAKLKSFMTMFQELIPGEGAGDGDAIDAAASETAKSKKMLAPSAVGAESAAEAKISKLLARLESHVESTTRLESIREICEDAGLRPTKEQKTLLLGQKTRKGVRRLVKVMLESAGSGNQRRLGVFGGTARTATQKVGSGSPEKIEDWAKSLRKA